MKTTKLLLVLAISIITSSLVAQDEVKISKLELQDKIKGSWAGQTIGVTWTKPSEAVFNGTMIQPYVQFEWGEDIVNRFMHNDDIYMDMIFMEVIEREGIDAPAKSHALEMAHKDFNLWHANQAARYNILQGIMPPASGHWRNNIHADCLDAQIEADFAGIMSPGMINAATKMTDIVSHIMNCGDAYYAGVHVALMYSLAFVHDDLEHVINEALEFIPKESLYYTAMKEVMGWHKTYPNDWKKTWKAIEESEWAPTIFCTRGLNNPYNIKALTNNAYILVGLLYGKKIFFDR